MAMDSSLDNYLSILHTSTTPELKEELGLLWQDFHNSSLKTWEGRVQFRETLHKIQHVQLTLKNRKVA